MVPEVRIEGTNNMKDVEELLKILSVANMIREKQQISILLEQMREMEKNQISMMQQLADVKLQLNVALEKMENGYAGQDRTNILRNITEQAGKVMEAQKQHLQDIKTDLNTKAKNLVQKFKDIGIKALNNVCGFLGIQEKLIKMRDHARSSAMDMQIAVEKITGLENEFESAMEHIKNAGRIAAGKENIIPKADIEKTHKRHKRFTLLGIYKSLCVKYQEIYRKRAEKLDRAIEKFAALEQKASVLDKLSEHKEKIASEKNGSAPDKSLENKKIEEVR